AALAERSVSASSSVSSNGTAAVYHARAPAAAASRSRGYDAAARTGTPEGGANGGLSVLEPSPRDDAARRDRGPAGSKAAEPGGVGGLAGSLAVETPARRGGDRGFDPDPGRPAAHPAHDPGRLDGRAARGAALRHERGRAGGLGRSIPH